MWAMGTYSHCGSKQFLMPNQCRLKTSKMSRLAGDRSICFYKEHVVSYLHNLRLTMSYTFCSVGGQCGEWGTRPHPCQEQSMSKKLVWCQVTEWQEKPDQTLIPRRLGLWRIHTLFCFNWIVLECWRREEGRSGRWVNGARGRIEAGPWVITTPQNVL